MGLKPYTCEIEGCDFATSYSSHLTRHKRIHSPEYILERKREETKIAKLLEANQIEFKREHHVRFNCLGGTYARIDFTIISNGVVIFLEVDEDQHAHYGVNCDVKRMNDVYSALVVDGNTLPVVFIHYNPHAFKVDGVTEMTKTKKRHPILINTIRSIINRSAELNPLSIMYLFYDCYWDGTPVILTDPEYDESMKEAYVGDIRAR
jgi:hypothetical protein